MLREEKENPAAQQRNTKASGLLDMLPNQFTTADAVLIGEELGVTERAVRLRLKVAVENKVIRRTTRGKYRKA